MTRKTLAGVGLAAGLTAGVVGFMPVYLPPLPEAAPEIPDGKALVFGYATLSNPVVRSVVVGRPVVSDPGALEGWTRMGRDLAAHPQGRVEGRVFAVSPRGLERLDRFEQTGLRYGRWLKQLEDGREVWVYRMIPPVSGGR